MKRMDLAVPWLAMAVTFGLTACATVAQEPPAQPAAAISTLPADRVETIDRLFSRLTELAMFSGTVIVDHGGEVVFSRSYGYANYETRTPFNDHTMFRIASVSKQMTDAALAAMIVNGHLRLDAHVSDYLPSFPRGDEITLQQIVEHTSGIPHPNDYEWGDGTHPLTLDEIIGHLAAMPLNFEPGTREEYSNGGFAVLTKIMETVSGESYPQFMRRLVFDPLGMQDTGVFGDSRAVIENMARGYEPGRAIGSLRYASTYFPEARPGGGSIYASAADVLRFAQAAWRGRMPGAQDYPVLFGGSDATRGATGSLPGFNSLLYQDRGADLIVVVLSNNSSFPYRLASNTAAIALGRPALYAAPEVQPDRPANPAWIGDWTYPFGDETNDVRLRRGVDGALVMDVNGHSFALLPMADGGYVEPLYQGLCHLRPDDANRIDCPRFAEGGFLMELTRRAP